LGVYLTEVDLINIPKKEEKSRNKETVHKSLNNS